MLCNRLESVMERTERFLATVLPVKFKAVFRTWSELVVSHLTESVDAERNFAPVMELN